MIWSETTIDDFRVTTTWVDPSDNATNFKLLIDVNLVAKLLEIHVHISKYLLLADCKMYERYLLQTFTYKYIESIERKILTHSLNPYVPNAPFLYPLKTSENFFLYFQEVEKGALETNWWILSKIPPLLNLKDKSNKSKFCDF